MPNSIPNLRKAAVLLRSVDAETAATLLAQLSTAEAAAVREAIRNLGRIDADEQAELLAEFRHSNAPSTSTGRGVELTLSSPSDQIEAATNPRQFSSTGKRFEFLESAPTSVIAPYLAREHAQTIAVVLSHLAPARAAAVLAELPAKLQADAIERLTCLGETDAESVTALERELAAWVSKRVNDKNGRTRRNDAVASILAAADEQSRDRILANLKSQKAELADQLAPLRLAVTRSNHETYEAHNRPEFRKPAMVSARLRRPAPLSTTPPAPKTAPSPRIEFDQLTHFDDRALASVLKATDANVLTLALAGSSDELVDRICDQMPPKTARSFRRELRRLGPTRLSDVEAAQRAVADVAAQQLAHRRHRLTSAAN